MPNAFTQRVLHVIDAQIAQSLAPHLAVFKQLAVLLRDFKSGKFAGTPTPKGRASKEEKLLTVRRKKVSPSGATVTRLPTARKPRVRRELDSPPAAPAEVKAVPPIIRRKSAAEVTSSVSSAPVSPTQGRFEAMLLEAQQRSSRTAE